MPAEMSVHRAADQANEACPMDPPEAAQSQFLSSTVLALAIAAAASVYFSRRR
jgi:hypothetical protein